MHGRINACSQPTQHRTPRATQGSTQAIRHLNTMRGWRTCSDHNNSLTALQSLQKQGVTSIKQAKRCRFQCIEGLRPVLITLQKRIRGDVARRMDAAALSVAIQLIPNTFWPRELLGQTMQGPVPEVSQAELLRGSQSLKNCKANGPYPGATTPDPTPFTHGQLVRLY